MRGVSCSSSSLIVTLTETQTGTPHHSQESGIEVHAVTTEKKKEKKCSLKQFVVSTFQGSCLQWQDFGNLFEFSMTTGMLGNSGGKKLQVYCSVGVGGTKLKQASQEKMTPAIQGSLFLAVAIGCNNQCSMLQTPLPHAIKQPKHETWWLLFWRCKFTTTTGPNRCLGGDSPITFIAGCGSDVSSSWELRCCWWDSRISCKCFLLRDATVAIWKRLHWLLNPQRKDDCLKNVRKWTWAAPFHCFLGLWF